MAETFPTTPRASSAIRVAALALGLAAIGLATRNTITSSDWIGRQLRKVEAGTRALEDELGGRQWFVGSALGLADIAVGCMLGYLDLRLPEFDWRSRHANLVGFSERIFSRPSFAATVPETQEITEVR